RVVALRMIAMSAGGSRAQAEAQRMITEKLFASFWGAAMLAAGSPPAVVVRHYRSRVRENERRLSPKALSPLTAHQMKSVALKTKKKPRRGETGLLGRF